MEKFENGLFIFRRDLRIIDNNGLNLLNDKCKNIYTIFIFTPEQVGSSNDYKSNNAVQFMIESLQDLDNEIRKKGGKLYCFYGHNDKIVADCIKAFDINIVCFNLDYSPYARKRDDSIIKLCEKMKTYVMYDYDYYLHSPNEIMSGAGTPYQKFTPYYETAIKIKVQAPSKASKLNLRKKDSHLQHKISLEDAMHKFTKENPDILVHGGREAAIKTLSIAKKTQQHYSITRNDIYKPTSLLSAYLKFGCISIREVYKAFHGNRNFIRQLYWRDFYGQILYHYPHVLGHAMKPNYNKIKWHHSKHLFDAWCDGKTNYPIVDAAMRQMNAIGWMHNRGRMIVSSFLSKILLINWQLGEKYFAEKLTDYDPANNNGGWQWSAGTGADSQPYFRIFNPYLQSKEYDPDCEYIKKWVPELKDVPPKAIHNWFKEWENYKDTGYGKPIVDYDVQKEKALQMYKDAF
jgi:deoxyribodipyrimidine photo-lyase